MFQEIYDKKLCENVMMQFTIVCKKEKMFVNASIMGTQEQLACDIDTAEQLDKTFLQEVYDKLYTMGKFTFKDENMTIDPDIVVKIPAKKTIKAKLVPVEGTISVKEMLKESMTTPIQSKEEVINNSNTEKVFLEQKGEELNPAIEQVNFEQPIELETEPIIQKPKLGIQEPVNEFDYSANSEKPYKDEQGYFQGGQPIIEGKKEEPIIVPESPKPNTGQINFDDF